MDLKLILLLVAVIGGILAISANNDFVGSVFDTDSCQPQKVNISGQVYNSKAELRDDVLSNGGETAWKDIQNNVVNWETQNGELYFKPTECDQVID